LAAHVELTDWINGHKDEAKQLLNQQISKETGKALSADVLNDSFGRLQCDLRPIEKLVVERGKVGL
jgi:hypothetical protein